ncbi:MAG: hypothetical protein M1820_006311 [Bogoriella megaspora]|nr:MAG: hypothetical protein M1820_006311 [Bogoriella megaspora]
MSSPLDRRASPFSQPPSWKTNVNRAKTKRWVEAKSYSYDGDDWGEADEFDEYGGPAEAPPPPKPTGLRQKTPISQSPDSSVPEPAPPQNLTRKQSFEHGDERRVISSGAPPTLPPLDTTQAPPRGPSHAPRSSAGGMGRPQPSIIPPAQYRPRRSDSAGWESTSNASMGSASIDFQHRRDFSPSAMPPPLTTRASPSPSPAGDSNVGARYPPRKSSLSQMQSSEQASSPPMKPVSSPQDDTFNPLRGRAPSGSEPATSEAKPLPFIRPADIYKRIEEERQKERASIDSERPSLDSLNRQDALASGETRSRSSSESFSRSIGRKSSFEHGSESSPFASSRTPLETVQERKSVYEPPIPTTDSGKAPEAATSATERTKQDASTRRPDPTSAGGFGFASDRPMLPHINQSSAFGDDIWPTSSTRNTTEPKTEDPLPHVAQTDPTPVVTDTADDASAALQHQPSLGFRSVVHQAFDRRDDRSVPPTPVSNPDHSISRDTSLVSRSNTDSTAGISPIMSRASSAAQHGFNRGAENREGHTPMIPEEPDVSLDQDSRRASRTSIGGAPRVSQKSSPAHSRDPSSEPPRGFKPGYRRSLDPPSSENSPARTPVVEENKQIPAGETGELQSVTGQSSVRKDPDTFNSASYVRDVQPTTPSLESPISRAESPSKGRVRDLAGKFNDIETSSKRSSSDSLRINSVPASSGDNLATNPKEDTGENLRPQLPGSWVSYAQSEASASGQSEVSNSQASHEHRNLENPEVTPTQKTFSDENPDLTPNTNKATNRRSLMAGGSPLAAVAAAGSAIAASLANVTGSSPKSSRDEARSPSPATDQAYKNYAVGDVQVRPLVPHEPQTSATTGLAPTPLPKDTPREEKDAENSSYFPTTESPTEQGQSYRANDMAPAARPTMLQRLDTDNTLPETESDRLRMEITQQLSPDTPTGPRASDGRQPREEFAYSAMPALHTDLPASTRQSPDSRRKTPRLTHKFSWESSEAPPSRSTPAESSTPNEIDARPGQPSELDTENPSELKSLPAEPISEPTTPSDATEPIATEGTPERFDDNIESGGPQQVIPETLSNANNEREPQSPQNVSAAGKAATVDDNTRIPPFREILAMKGAKDRISTYNKTREQFSQLNTGLGNWIQTTLTTYPEHASLASPDARAPLPVPSVNIPKHKASPSILKLAKAPTGGHRQRSSLGSTHGEEDEAPTSSPIRTSQHGSAGRVASQQVQAKGKDLLKNAGVLGGKATTGAKGLFAKGRSKLQNRGSDKFANETTVDYVRKQASSVSSESSSTRRFLPSARRSRPVSLAIPPRETFTFDSIDAATFPRTTAQRPQSYAAPEIWDGMLRPSRVQSPSRLGVLPSPAQETFPNIFNQSLDVSDAEQSEQAVLDSIVRNASPTNFTSTLPKSQSDVVPQQRDMVDPNSIIATLPSQQRPRLKSDLDVEEDSKTVTKAPETTDISESATDISEIPPGSNNTEEAVLASSSEAQETEAEAKQDPVEAFVQPPTRFGVNEVHHSTEALHPGAPSTAQRSSVSSIEGDGSRNNSEPSASGKLPGFKHMRKVSGLGSEGKFDPEGKTKRQSRQLSVGQSDPGFSEVSDTSGRHDQKLPNSDIDNQITAEARNRAQEYFARSIPDKPVSPPVHPALRDLPSDASEQETAISREASPRPSRPDLTPNLSDDRRVSNIISPPASEGPHSPAYHNQRQPSQPDARYGPFPPQTQDGARQYTRDEMSSAQEIVTPPIDHPQQGLHAVSSGPISPMQYQQGFQQPIYAWNHTQSRPGVYRQSSGEVYMGHVTTPSNGTANNNSNSRYLQLRDGPGPPVSTMTVTTTQIQNSQNRRPPQGYSRGPASPPDAAQDRNRPWESIGTQRSETVVPAPIKSNSGQQNILSQDPSLQRASTSSKTEGRKKKRFSMLGSLFGRSGSTGHAQKQSNKLTKNNSSRRSQVLPASPSIQQWAESSSNPRDPQYPNVPAPSAGPRSMEPNNQGSEWQRAPQARAAVPQQKYPPAQGYYAPSTVRDNRGPPSQARIQQFQDPHEQLYNPSAESAAGAHGRVISPASYVTNEQLHGQPQQRPPNTPQSRAAPRAQSYGRAPPQQPQYRPQHRQSSASSYSAISPASSGPNNFYPPSSPYSDNSQPTRQSALLQNPSFAPPDTVHAPQQHPTYQTQQRYYQQQTRPRHDDRYGSVSSIVAARSPPQSHVGQQTPWELQLPQGEDRDAGLYRQNTGEGWPLDNRGYQQQQQQPMPPRYGQGFQGRYGNQTQGPTYTGQVPSQQMNRSRRDDDLVMRGASYPGQEWAPEGLAHGWD